MSVKRKGKTETGRPSALEQFGGAAQEVVEAVTELRDLWQACKDAELPVALVLDALEQGDTVEEVREAISAVILVGLPGAIQGYQAALRFLRVRRGKRRNRQE